MSSLTIRRLLPTLVLGLLLACPPAPGPPAAADATGEPPDATGCAERGDADGDGVCDDEDLCPAGPDASDADGDGLADACDPCPVDPDNDSDGDGSCDSQDLCPGFDDADDRDGDGIPAGCEACADEGEEDVFSPSLAGCAGTVTWDSRSRLCGPGRVVCSAARWVAERGGATPTHNYWTDDDLGYDDGLVDGAFACLATESGGATCPGEPMRVCAGRSDPLGNRCGWTDCGYRSLRPSEHLGGCASNPTAGSLCCTP